MGTSLQQQPNLAPSPDPSKKYWWVVGIAVPIVVALIGLIAQHWQPSAVTPPAPTASTPAGGMPGSQTFAPPADRSGSVLDGTVWRGVFVGPVPKPFEREMEISFTGSRAVIAYYQGIFWVTHHNCEWTSPRTDSVQIDCYPETVRGQGFWPNRSLQVPPSGIPPNADVDLPRETTLLTISGSAMSGTRTTEEDETSLKFNVTVKRLP
jgi:hypothetical protein